jgi:hypothetical protein
MLFREIIAVYCENHMEHTNALCINARGTYNYRWDLKGHYRYIVCYRCLHETNYLHSHTSDYGTRERVHLRLHINWHV